MRHDRSHGKRLKAEADDWRDLFYLDAFLQLTLAERHVERREQVWIRRFLENRGKPELDRRMEEIILAGHCDAGELDRLTARARAELSNAEKRRFVYNVAQLFQSSGALGTRDYERVLVLTEKLGLPDTETDAMLRSAYRINDSFIAIMGLLAVGAILYLTRSVLIPLVIALFLTMIVDRTGAGIARILRLGRPRWYTTVAALVAILGTLAGLIVASVSASADIVARFPAYKEIVEAELERSHAAQSILTALGVNGQALTAQQLPLGELARGVFGSALSLVSNVVLVIIFTGFLVAASASFTGVLDEMKTKVGTYISVKSLVCLLTGAAVYGLCRVFGVDFALFFAFLAFLLSYLPVIGSIVSSVPPIILAIVKFEAWWPVVLLALCLVAVNVVLGQVLEPRLLGSRLALKPLGILVGLAFWGLLWGLPGMILATPLMVLLRILASQFHFSRSLERLLSTDTT